MIAITIAAEVIVITIVGVGEMMRESIVVVAAIVIKLYFVSFKINAT